MGNTFKFASIARTGIAYVIHTDSMALWDRAYRTPGALTSNWGEYQTYGDCMIQHEYENAVVVGNLADFCASATKFVLSAKWFHDTDFARRDFVWACGVQTPTAEICEFVLSLRAKDGKDTYYSLSTLKTSSTSAKQHDKRWSKVDRDCDGTIEPAYRILASDKRWMWELWQIWEALRNATHDYSASTERKFLGEANMNTGAHTAAAAFTAVIRMLQAHDSAECELGNWVRNHAPKAETEEMNQNSDSVEA